MIVVDTSALLAIALAEPNAAKVNDALQRAEAIALSAATLAETLVVAGRRGRAAPVANLLADLDAEIVPVSEEFAFLVAQAYDKWGKGVHPAKLNFADCFAYALAIERDCPLLFVGDDFSKTDVKAALDAAGG